MGVLSVSMVKRISPSEVDDWSSGTATVTIHGENFIATPSVRLNDTILSEVHWVDGHTLVVTIPNNLKAGLYIVWVTNPGGQENALLNGLQVGKRVCFPVLKR
jgi:hypothetical protein